MFHNKISMLIIMNTYTSYLTDHIILNTISADIYISSAIYLSNSKDWELSCLFSQ